MNGLLRSDILSKVTLDSHHLGNVGERPTIPEQDVIHLVRIQSHPPAKKIRSYSPYSLTGPQDSQAQFMATHSRSGERERRKATPKFLDAQSKGTVASLMSSSLPLLWLHKSMPCSYRPQQDFAP